MAAVLEASGLWKTYRSGAKSLDVVKNVSLTVEEGEIVAVLGPSGAGKTTLLHILSGLDEPTKGDVKLLGHRLADLRGSRRARFINASVGFVFQFYHLLGDLTAIENILLPTRISGNGDARAARRKADELIEEIGLASRAHHYPSELSGGEQQRVAIARAVMNDPQILFCDEPTGNLDSATGETVSRILAKLAAKAHKTILIVTHDDKIARMAGRLVRLKDGALDAGTQTPGGPLERVGSFGL